MKPLMRLFIFGGLIFLTACGGAAAPTNSEEANPPLSTPPPADAADEPVQPATSAEKQMVNLSIENLTRKLKINADKVNVVKITKVTWRDASLGCPKPGIDYLRVETSGYTIILEVDGKTYEYHTDESRRVTLCSTQPKGSIPKNWWKG